MARKKGVSLAQSGGRNTTFGGGKGGTKLTRGVTAGKVIGHGSQNGVNSYAIRGDGGNKTTVPSKGGRVGPPPPVHAGGAGNATAIVRPHQNAPVLRGSTNAKKGKYK